MNNIDELNDYIDEYDKANKEFYYCLQLGDENWNLYSKRMACAWKKIRICLDGICHLPLETIQKIAEIAREQDTQYLGDCISLYAKFRNGDVK